MPDNLKIHTANLHFNADGTPVADDFDDVYFSNDDGLAETQYVFLSGNRLHKRWRAHSCSAFTVAETGFGSGMNFLACWQAFADHLAAHPQSQCQRLHFISFEKFPLAPESLAQCHQQFPSIQAYAQQLQQAYPNLMPGCHRLSFQHGRVTLDLWVGDVNELIPQVASPRHGVVDAWFLDGFAPSKNPQMWSDNLFQHMFRLAKPQATVATFTAAGLVRRGLAAAGFNVSKIPGYGNKRDMTVAHKSLPGPVQTPAEAKQVTIIGGGLAGCFAAWELAQKGFQIRLLCADDALASQASGNRQGALYPLLNGAYDTLADFYCHAYRDALVKITTLIERHPEIRHQWCGVLHLSSNEELIEKHQSLTAAAYPDSLIHSVSAAQASDWAGIQLPHPGVFYPQGGWLCPGDLCRAIAEELSMQGHLFEFNAKVDSIEHDQTGWKLSTARQIFQAEIVVIAAGTQSTEFEVSRHFPLTSVRGQVSHVKATETSEKLKTVLCHTGYLTPAQDGGHCLGATFVRGSHDKSLREDEHQTNLERLENAIPNSELSQHWQHSPLAGRVGFRASVRDHLPLIGPVPDWHHLPKPGQVGELAQLATQPNLYLFTGLGARGLCSAPLGASILASYVAGESQPAPQKLLDAIHPGRFAWRRLKKNKTVFG